MFPTSPYWFRQSQPVISPARANFMPQWAQGSKRKIKIEEANWNSRHEYILILKWGLLLTSSQPPLHDRQNQGNQTWNWVSAVADHDKSRYHWSSEKETGRNYFKHWFTQPTDPSPFLQQKWVNRTTKSTFIKKHWRLLSF